ncbi:hypothetical protein V7O66_13905 [Methanolobus sp. ZRKC3]|uniref:hypothetical protein n=1 Tax=Methanolobus sp. ZRKC3 TaxID=3125786 RepID=UPI0032545D93
MEDTIKPLELALFQKREQRDRMNEDIHSIKKAATLDVLELSKDKDTAKEMGLTNQAGRDMLLEDRLQEDPEYQRLINAVHGLETNIAMMQIDLSFEQRKFKVWYVEQLKIANGVD